MTYILKMLPVTARKIPSIILMKRGCFKNESTFFMFDCSIIFNYLRKDIFMTLALLMILFSIGRLQRPVTAMLFDGTSIQRSPRAQSVRRLTCAYVLVITNIMGEFAVK